MIEVTRRSYARSGSSRTPLAVGRIDRKTAEMVLPRRRSAPFPGPWTLHAVVASPDGEGPREPTKVIPFPGVQDRG